MEASFLFYMIQDREGGFESLLTNIHTKNKKRHLMVSFLFWRRRRDSLFCGKATAVAACHRHPAKSRLSNPSISFRTKKHHPMGGVFCGGEGGIRTLETLLTPTRFPIVRARPTTRLLQVVKLIYKLNCKRNGGPSGTRTQDRPVMSRML